MDEDWQRYNLHSDVAVVFNIEEKKAVIFGTFYGGENKKGIFSLMNYWLPMDNQFPMHCSANVCKETDESALFFGLSGTGESNDDCIIFISRGRIFLAIISRLIYLTSI